MLELDKLYNLDCMEGMKEFPDKYFDLAIVDVPYGINATKRHICAAESSTEMRLRLRKNIHTRNGTNNRRPLNILQSLCGLAKIKLYGAQIILLVKFPLIPLVG